MPRRREHTVYSPIEFADICFERHHTYVEEASTGRVTVPGQNEPVEIGELEYLAVQRYLNDLKNPAYTVDENEVDRVYQFYAKLTQQRSVCRSAILACSLAMLHALQHLRILH